MPTLLQQPPGQREGHFWVSQRGLGVRGIPEGIVRYLFPHLSTTGRGQKGSQHRGEPSESVKSHKCSSYTTCRSMAVLCESPRWRIKLSVLLEFTTGNSYNHPSPICRVTWATTVTPIKHEGTHNTQGRGSWLGKEGGTGGLWRKVSIPAGLWSLRKKLEGTAFKDGDNVGKSRGDGSSQSLSKKEKGLL